ncbi:MAG: hypothetical protein KDJ65_09460 [Anaerolineae bacterium]|nr:hypothetical protein [Anaerolineae bacterium]
MTTNLKTSTSLTETTEQGQQWLSGVIRIWALIVLTLHLSAASLPEDSAWSLWPYTFVPTWLGWVLALLVGALVIAPVNDFVSHGLHRLWLALPAKHAKHRWFAAIALLSGVLFWLARLRHLRWGDSYLLSIALSYPDLDLRVIYNWQAPLTVFLHQRLWQYVADPLLGWPVENVYATVSIVCGMIFVYLLLVFTSHLGRDVLETAILAGLLLTTGSVQLFFGYVENYVIISLLLLGTLFLAWLALQGRPQPVWPVLGLAVTNAFHPSTVFIWPGMLLLSFLCWRRGRVSMTGAVLQTVLPPLLIGGGVFALMESGSHGVSALTGVDRPGGGDGVWFVPIFSIDPEWANYQPYLMFSTAHLLDWLNIHFLISPFGIPIIVMTLTAVAWYRLPLFDSIEERDFGAFLGLTAAMYIVFTWLWNADYGGRKDWDLFAPSAFVYTLLAGYLLVRALPDRRLLKESGLLVIAVGLLHTAAWIFTNTHPLPRD